MVHAHMCIRNNFLFIIQGDQLKTNVLACILGYWYIAEIVSSKEPSSIICAFMLHL